MECKFFFGTSRNELEKQVNMWLKTHPVSPDSMRFQFSMVAIDDVTEYKLEHTLVVFFVPMRAIG